MLTETLHTQLAEIASIEAITHENPTVDGKQPALGVAPRSVPELAAVVTELYQAESATILVGGGTMLDLGKPPSAAEVALCTRGLNTITEYQPADLIVTAQAGVTLANLQETLREHDQTLPLQVPCPDRATVGGAVAANDSRAVAVYIWHRQGPCHGDAIRPRRRHAGQERRRSCKECGRIRLAQVARRRSRYAGSDRHDNIQGVSPAQSGSVPHIHV